MRPNVSFQPARALIRVFLAATAVACARGESASSGGLYTTRYGHLADSVVHLQSGDSLEFQATGAATVDSGPPGLMVTYFPFAGLSDTSRVRSVALEFFRQLRPHMFGNPAFVVMRAVDVRASVRQQTGLYSMHTYGVVIEKRADGRWYPMGEAVAVPDK